MSGGEKELQELIRTARAYARQHGHRVRGGKVVKDLIRAVERFDQEIEEARAAQRKAMIGKWIARPHGRCGYKPSWGVERDVKDDVLNDTACRTDARDARQVWAWNRYYAETIAALLNAHEKVRGEPMPRPMDCEEDIP